MKHVWMRLSVFPLFLLLLPLFCGHSANMTVLANAACNLLRATSLVGFALTPNGCSERTSPPFSKILCWRGAFSLGCMMLSPDATMAIVRPPASRHPSCADLSQPKARPLTIILPSFAYLFPNSYAFLNPIGEAARAPMMAIRVVSVVRSDISPKQ